MHVGEAVPPRAADELFWQCDAAKRRAEIAIARSRHLVHCAARLRKRSLVTRLTSRRLSHYASIDGTIGGAPVLAVIRRDGTVTADPLFQGLILANLGSNLGSNFGANPGSNLPAPLGNAGLARMDGHDTLVNGHDPLLVTVTAVRSCDRVRSLALHRAGRRPHLPAIQLAACAGKHVAPIEDELPAQLAIDVAGDADEHVVRLRGELDIADAGRVHDLLMGTAGSRMVVDVSQLTFIDARGISAIVAARSAIIEAGHPFSIRGARGIVRRVFELTDLGTLLDD